MIALTEVFAAVLAIYLGYSLWAGINSRYPLVMALALLVAASLLDAEGNHGVANTFAAYVLILLLGGAILLIAEYVRSPSRTRGSIPRVTKPRVAPREERRPP